MEYIGKCKMKTHTILVWTTVFLTMLISTKEAMKLDMSGYENCILHLVDGTENGTEGDEIFTELIKEHPYMRHTVSTLTGTPYLKDERHFQEFCSVNIIVLLDSQYSFDPTEILGSRPLYAKNIVVFILSQGNTSPYKFMKNGIWDYEYRVSIGIYMLPDLTTIHRAEAFLSRSASIRELLPKPITVVNDSIALADVRKIDKRDWWVGPALLAGSSSYKGGGSNSESAARSCASVYAESRADPGVLEVGCSEELLFLENFARMFNMTTTYIPENSVEHADYYKRDTDYLGMVVFRSKARTWAWATGLFGHSAYVNQYLVDTKVEKFVYCTTKVDREPFKFRMWLLPFDTNTWTLIVACLLALTILMKGNPLAAIFLFVFRQEVPGIVQNRYIIGFSLVSIILSCFYDCVISTHLTTPPPISIYDNVRELVEKKYKIVGYREESYEIDQYNQYNTPLESLFENENLNMSQMKKTGFIFQQSWNNDNISKFLSYCNTTYPTTESNLIELLVMDHDPKVHCQTLKTSKLIEPDTYSLSGWYIEELRRVTRRYVESGILQHWRNFGKYVRSRYGEDLALKETREEEENSFKPFTSSDMKILSMFLMYAVLAFLAIIVLLVEIEIRQLKCKRRVRASRLPKSGTPLYVRPQPSLARTRARLHSPDVQIHRQPENATIPTLAGVHPGKPKEPPVEFVTTEASVHRIASPILFVAPDGTVHDKPEDIRITIDTEYITEAVQIPTVFADYYPQERSEHIPPVLFAAPDGTIYFKPKDTSITIDTADEAEFIHGQDVGQCGTHPEYSEPIAPVHFDATEETIQRQAKDIGMVTTLAQDQLGDTQESLVAKPRSKFKRPSFIHKNKILPSKSERPKISWSDAQEAQPKPTVAVSRASILNRAGRFPRILNAPRISIFDRIPKVKPKPAIPTPKEFKSNETKISKILKLPRSKKFQPRKPRVSIFDRVAQVAPKPETETSPKVKPKPAIPTPKEFKSNETKISKVSKLPRSKKFQPRKPRVSIFDRVAKVALKQGTSQVPAFISTGKQKRNRAADPNINKQEVKRVPVFNRARKPEPNSGKINFRKKAEGLRVWVFDRFGNLQLKPETVRFSKKPEASKISVFSRAGGIKRKLKDTQPKLKFEAPRAGRPGQQSEAGEIFYVAPAENPGQSKLESPNLHLFDENMGVPSLTPAEM